MNKMYHSILKCILLVIYIFFDLISARKMEYIKISRNIFGQKKFLEYPIPDVFISLSISLVAFLIPVSYPFYI